jgi:hypothetical protein
LFTPNKCKYLLFYYLTIRVVIYIFEKILKKR